MSEQWYYAKKQALHDELAKTLVVRKQLLQRVL
jgi:hypothetical protein